MTKTVELDWIQNVRRHLHSIAELSFAEIKTADWLEQQIREMGFIPRRMAGTGLVVDIDGQDLGLPRVLIRADIDALPIEEKTKLPFASQNVGVMHACGHDGHAAMVLAALKEVSAYSVPPRCGLRFIFQPAEEQGGGAEVMVREGVLDGVGEAYGLHLCNRLPSGRVGLGSGPFSAFIDEFEIRIEGQGGHAARPYLCTEPIVIASRLIQESQWLMAREINAMRPGVLTYSSIHSGQRFNVIANDCVLGGTVRFMHASVREFVLKRLRQKMDLLQQEYGCNIEFELYTGYPAIENCSEKTENVRQAAVTALGPDCVTDEIMGMGGEDFSYIAREVPSCYFLLGSGGSGEDFAPHHNPHFNFDENVLFSGFQIFLHILSQRAWTKV